MLNFLKLLYLCISLCACNTNYAVISDKTNHNLADLSCSDLMFALIKDSSFKEFQDKNLALEFYFERSDDKHIGLTFVRRSGIDKNGIYGNFELDLDKCTLMNIDPDPAISIKIKKKYIPFIAEKCTPDQNIYGNTGRMPEKEFDSN